MPSTSHRKIGRHKLGTRGSRGLSPGSIQTCLTRDAVERGLTRLLDWGIASVIFVAPLFMGGRHPLGRLVYVTLICLTATAWAARQIVRRSPNWRWSGAEGIIAAGLALLILQLWHLPQTWLTAISPNLPQYLPLWSEADSSVMTDHWSQLSLYPEATRGAITMFSSYALFFLVLIQRIETLEDVERLLRWIALAAVAMAALGIVQMLSGNGKFLWIYHHPSRDTNGLVTGTFANQNHMAHLLAIGLVPLIWWAQHVLNGGNDARFTGRHSAKAGPPQSAPSPSKRRVLHEQHGNRRSGAWSTSKGKKELGETSLSLLLIGVAIVALAGLLTFSRGGVLVMLLASTCCVLCYFAMSLLGRKCLAAVVGVSFVLILALFMFGLDKLAGEMATVASVSVDEANLGDTRLELWSADWKTFQQFLAVGTGVGTHSEVYPVHFEKNLDVELKYAESGYVQLLMETGAAGTILLLVAMALILFWWVSAFRGSSDNRARSILVVIGSVLLASLVHSIWDFVWYIPACLIPTLVFLACLCRLRRLTRPSSSSRASNHQDRPSPRIGPANRLIWAVPIMLIAVAGYEMILVHLPKVRGSSPWEVYETAVYAAQTDRKQESRGRDSLLATLPALQTAVRRDPNNARIQLKLAALYLLQFDTAQQKALNPMSLDQIRDVVHQSEFSSLHEQNQWLKRAIGDNCTYLHLAYHHAYRAAELSPFQGEAYIHLDRLRFLRYEPTESRSGLLQQALLVRPHHGQILITAGVEAIRVGDLTGGIDYFRRAFHKGRVYQQRVIQVLAASVPATFFLEELKPDLEGLGQLLDAYQELGRTDDMRKLLPRYMELLSSVDAPDEEKDLAPLWLRGYAAHKVLAQQQEAVRCLQHAVKVAPDHSGANLALAKELIAAQQYDEAIEHLRSCLYHHPDDLALKQLLVLARKGQLGDGLELSQQPSDDSKKRRRR